MTRSQLNQATARRVVGPARVLAVLSVFACLAAPVVRAQDFVITTAELPNAIIGLPYEAVPLTTENGFGPVDWTFGPNSLLPVNFVVGRSGPETPTTGVFCWGTLTIDKVAQCSGDVAGQPGLYEFTIRAKDNIGRIVDRFFTLRIESDLVILSEAQLPDAVIGIPYDVTLQAVGGTGNYLWSKTSGTLPPGFTLSQATGRIAGTPGDLVVGNYTFTIRVVDSVTSAEEEKTFHLNVTTGVSILTNTLPLLVRNEAMEPFQLMADGAEFFVWRVSANYTLPGSMTLSSEGVLMGAVGETGAYPIRLEVRDLDHPGTWISRVYTIYVTLGPLGILQTELPVAAQDTLYDFQMTGKDGLPPYTWSFGTLATQGLVIDNLTGRITGTPTASGNFSLPIAVRDSTGTQYLGFFTLRVANEVRIVSELLLRGRVGEPYLQNLQAAGGESPYRWSIVAGDLPQGLTLDPIFGRIQGTPTRNEGAAFTLQVQDNGGRIATKQFALVIGDQVVITTQSLPDAVKNQPYAQAFQAVNGAQPLTWTLESLFSQLGAPGNIFTLNPATGVLTGTPDTLDTLTLRIRVTDAAQDYTVREFTLIVADPLVISSGPAPTGNLNAPFHSQVVASGGRPPYAWSLNSGSLPPGLAIDTTTGAVSGTPTSAGTYSFEVHVADAGGQTSVASRSITVGNNVLMISTNQVSYTLGQPFSVTLEASGGTPPYSWSTPVQNLSRYGLSLNPSTGVISGTPNTELTRLFVHVMDAAQQSADKEVNVSTTYPPAPSLTIVVPLSVQSGDQVPVALRIADPYLVPIHGSSLTLSFTPAGTGGDAMISLISGAFEIPAGQTSAVFLAESGGATIDPYIITGTTAGTITLNAQMSATGSGPQLTAQTTIAIASEVPVLTGATLQRNGNTVTVVVDGYANTHQVNTGTFTFTPATGATLEQSTFTVPLGTAFTTWFSNSASTATGGQFRLTLPFTVSGNASQVSSVSVTLTNDQGTSVAVTGQ